MYDADIPKLGAFRLDLDGKFTSGSENENNRAITGAQERLTDDDISIP